MTSHSSREEIATYRADPRAHYSALSRFAAAGTPGKYRWGADHPEPASKSMILGGAVDSLLFTPDWFAEDYTTPPLSPDDMPEWMVLAPGGQTKAAKAERDEIEASGRVPVKEEDFDISGLKMNTAAGKAWRTRERRRVLSHEEEHDVRSCVDAIRHHPIAANILAPGRYQVPVYGAMCKALPDIFAPGALADLKTTQDCSPERVQWSIDEYRYHWQAALYIDVAEENGYTISEWRWIFAEPVAPYRVEVSAPAPLSLIELGREQYRATLARYLVCKENDHWPISTYSELRYDLPARAYNAAR